MTGGYNFESVFVETAILIYGSIDGTNGWSKADIDELSPFERGAYIDYMKVERKRLEERIKKDSKVK